MDLSVGAVRAHIFLGGNERGGPPHLSGFCDSQIFPVNCYIKQGIFPIVSFFHCGFFLGNDRASFVHVNLGGPSIAFVHVNLGRPSIAWQCSCERVEALL